MERLQRKQLLNRLVFLCFPVGVGYFNLQGQPLADFWKLEAGSLPVSAFLSLFVLSCIYYHNMFEWIQSFMEPGNSKWFPQLFSPLICCPRKMPKRSSKSVELALAHPHPVLLDLSLRLKPWNIMAL